MTRTGVLGRLWPVLRGRVLSPGLDLVLVAIAYWASFQLRFDGQVPVPHIAQYWLFFLAIPPLRVVCYGLYGLYRHVWRYVGLREAFAMLLASLTGSAAFTLLLYLSHNGSFPRSIVGIELVLSMLLVGGARFVVRYRFEQRGGRPGTSAIRTLIVGAGDAGEMLARDLRRYPERYTPVGFVDDRGDKRGLRIHGIPVLGGHEAIPELVKRHEVGLVMVAIPSAERKRRQEILQLAATTPARIKTLPSLQDVVDGRVELNDLRDVQLEDLLGRDPVVLDNRLLGSYLGGKRVLVTGAGGSIGSELCRQIAQLGPERLVLLGHGENSIYNLSLELKQTHPNLDHVPVIADVKDAAALRAAFATHRPDVVFHAAAHKHVPLMEANVVEAAANNVLGTLRVAEAALDAGVSRFVLISTDKAVNPTSVMGMTKRMAELAVQRLSQEAEGRSREEGRGATTFVAVRFGNVLGSRGSVVPLFRRQIAQGGPVTVTHPDMTRYFMTIPEAATLVMQAGALGHGGEVLLLDMGEPVRILDLARNMIKLSGLTEDDVEIAFTGVRPGEKLFEELLVTSEGTRPTVHPQIFAARTARPLAPEAWERLREQLLSAVAAQDPLAVREVLTGAIALDRAAHDSAAVREG